MFTLEPEAEDASIIRIRLALSGGELRRMELIDQLGQTTLLTFREVRREPEIPADTFTFTPPAGVDFDDRARVTGGWTPIQGTFQDWRANTRRGG